MKIKLTTIRDCGSSSRQPDRLQETRIKQKGTQRCFIVDPLMQSAATGYCASQMTEPTTLTRRKKIQLFHEGISVAIAVIRIDKYLQVGNSQAQNSTGSQNPQHLSKKEVQIMRDEMLDHMRSIDNATRRIAQRQPLSCIAKGNLTRARIGNEITLLF